MNQEKVIIFDYGSQYTLLIAQHVRRLQVYNEVLLPTPKNFDRVLSAISKNSSIKAIILSGGPESVVTNSKVSSKHLTTFKKFSRKLTNKMLISDETIHPPPILGICFGAQLLAQFVGADVRPDHAREYGKTEIQILDDTSPLLQNVGSNAQVWMSHSDSIFPPNQNLSVNTNFQILAQTSRDNQSVIAAFESRRELIRYNICCRYYGLQFHPEVSHTPCGATIFDNFLHMADCNFNWTHQNIISQIRDDIRAKVGPENEVLIACSGGVDSTVTATLLNGAIGDRMIGVFVNNGLLRSGEYEHVMGIFRKLGLNVRGIDASEKFLTALRGVTDPEQKRKIIGATFIDVFQKYCDELREKKEKEKKNSSQNSSDNGIQFLAQGTIYSDVIESHGGIKSHHNVGGLPETMSLQLIEPVRQLFKNEVREIGLELGIPAEFINRHPFPGPGLAIRILGEVTPAKVRLLQAADKIFVDSLVREGHYDNVWQAGTILTDSRAVGVMGDNRTYEAVVVLRAVCSLNVMTADVANLPHEFLTNVATNIVNNVPGINRVVYDITSKPPGTIEWE